MSSPMEPTSLADVENVVCSLNRIKAIRGKYSAEELSGEPPQAMITCYDEGDNEIYTVKFYDGFMMVDNELYRIIGKVYKELAELCDKYGAVSYTHLDVYKRQC